MASDLYLGYRNDDADTPFGKFFKPEMAPLPQHVVVALQHGPQAGMALLAFDDAASIVDEGYQQTENGYGILGDGSMQVSVRTDMPGVTPAMWAWWFGWHGSANVFTGWRTGCTRGRRRRSTRFMPLRSIPPPTTLPGCGSSLIRSPPIPRVGWNASMPISLASAGTL